jgi:hypothetical protein
MCEKNVDVKTLQQNVSEEVYGKADIAVTVDGLLLRRGHTSNVGTATLFTVGISKIVDC